MRKWRLRCVILFLGAASTIWSQGLDLLERPDKTELVDPFGVVAAVGGEFGLPTMWWWHRISAGWGSVRRKVAQLYISDPATGKLFTVEGGRRTWTPDHLRQQLELDKLLFSEDKFVDKDGIADSLQIRNQSDAPRKLRLYFVGKAEGRSRISFDKSRNRLLLAETKDYGVKYLPGPFVVYQEIAISAAISGWGVGAAAGDLEKFMDRPLGFGVFIDDANVRKYLSTYEGMAFYYAIQLDVSLPARQSSNLTLCSTFGRDPNPVAAQSDRLLRDARPILAHKEDQLREQIANDWPRLKTPDEKLNRLWPYLWYVLNANRSGKGAAVKADFNVPTKFGYWGCYVWDTAFHVIGQSFLRDKQIAEDSVRALLSLQFPNGFLPVNSGADDVEVVTPEGTYNVAPADFYDYQEQANPFLSRLTFQHPNPHQWGVTETRRQVEVLEKTQLPIIGMAVEELYRVTGDKAFLSEIYPALAKYDDWMWRRRNTGDGLLVWYNGDESGWDNAARLLPLPVKTVDGSVAAYLLRKALSDAAVTLGREQDATNFRERAELTARSINTKMWNEQTRFYHDLSLQDIQRAQKSPAGFMPLLGNFVSGDRKADLIRHLKNPKEFWTAYPIPTVSRDDPDFDSNTWGWNGPTWIPSNWLVMEGLARAGRVDAANEVLTKTIEMMSQPGGFPTASEQYNSQTGMPFGVADYSWCGVINHYVTKWVAGIQADAANNAVTVAPRPLAGWPWFELENVRVGDHTLGMRLDRSTVSERLTINHVGVRQLSVNYILPATGEVRSVTVNRRPLSAADYQLSDGAVRFTSGLASRETIVEVLYR
jgi:hypothetical protein